VKLLRPRVLLALLADVILVLVFVVVGRVSHKEDLSGIGILTTLWPFLVGLLIGWFVTRSWNAPLHVLWNGFGIWLMTILFGMILRAVSGQGLQLSFVAVAAVVLAVFLLGWRGIARLVTRPRRDTAV
jgi:peptidoglycan/LPS O-acetylase OafA/YrhL